MSTLLIDERGVRGGLLVALIAVWLSIAVLVAALLVAEFAPVHVSRERADQVLSTLLPNDLAALAELVP